MTMQVQDKFTYNGEVQSLCFKEYKSQFDIDFVNNYSMTPCFIATYCYNGYWCYYSIDTDALYLTDIFIHAEEYKPIHGKMPIEEPPIIAKNVNNKNDICLIEANLGHKHYVLGKVPFKYTGRLLITSGQIKECGLWRRDAYAYKKLTEISFIDGDILEIIDKSNEGIKHRNYEIKIMSILESEAKKNKIWKGRNTKYWQRYSDLEKKIREEHPYPYNKNWWDDIFLL